MLELVAFIAGASVMVLEMTGARLFAPFLGSSILVWTAIIGVVLASLSLGYWLGGKAADRAPSNKKLSVLLSGAGFCVLIVAIGHKELLVFVANMGLSLQVSAIAAALFMFLPPAMLLGMVSPYIIRVVMENRKIDAEHSGTIMGRFFAISSLGSILGTFLGGYVLISWLGSNIIIYLVALAIMIASLLSLEKFSIKSMLFSLIGITVCSIFTTIAINDMEEQKELANSPSFLGVIRKDTLYSNVSIITTSDNQGKKTRFMATDPHMVQSGVSLENPNALVLNYTRHYSIGWRIRPEAKRFLMLGGGAYSVPRYLLSSRIGVTVDVVEIDPGITTAAKDYFFLKDDERMKIYHEDARVFLNKFANTREKSEVEGYDIIMGDTFGSAYNIPFHMGTVECAQKIHTALNEDGIFIGNIISGIEGDAGQLLRSIRASFSTVFADVRVFPLSYTYDGAAVQNFILLATKKIESMPSREDFEAMALGKVMPEGPASSDAVKAEAAVCYNAVGNEWKKEIEKTPPLYDNYAPVERYSMPMVELIYNRK